MAFGRHDKNKRNNRKRTGDRIRHTNLSRKQNLIPLTPSTYQPSVIKGITARGNWWCSCGEWDYDPAGQGYGDDQYWIICSGNMDDAQDSGIPCDWWGGGQAACHEYCGSHPDNSSLSLACGGGGCSTGGSGGTCNCVCGNIDLPDSDADAYCGSGADSACCYACDAGCGAGGFGIPAQYDHYCVSGSGDTTYCYESPGEYCPTGYVPDCSGYCGAPSPYCIYENGTYCVVDYWIGDGYCDDSSQVYGADLSCYQNDGGDCSSAGCPWTGNYGLGWGEFGCIPFAAQCQGGGQNGCTGYCGSEACTNPQSYCATYGAAGFRCYCSCNNCNNPGCPEPGCTDACDASGGTTCWPNAGEIPEVDVCGFCCDDSQTLPDLPNCITNEALCIGALMGRG